MATRHEVTERGRRWWTSGRAGTDGGAGARALPSYLCSRRTASGYALTVFRPPLHGRPLSSMRARHAPVTGLAPVDPPVLHRRSGGRVGHRCGRRRRRRRTRGVLTVDRRGLERLHRRRSAARPGSARAVGSTASNLVVPAGIISTQVTLIGGGGGGSATSAFNASGGVGGGGAQVVATIPAANLPAGSVLYSHLGCGGGAGLTTPTAGAGGTGESNSGAGSATATGSGAAGGIAQSDNAGGGGGGGSALCVVASASTNCSGGTIIGSGRWRWGRGECRDAGLLLLVGDWRNRWRGCERRHKRGRHRERDGVHRCRWVGHVYGWRRRHRVSWRRRNRCRQWQSWHGRRRRVRPSVKFREWRPAGRRRRRWWRWLLRRWRRGGGAEPLLPAPDVRPAQVAEPPRPSGTPPSAERQPSPTLRPLVPTAGRRLLSAPTSSHRERIGGHGRETPEPLDLWSSSTRWAAVAANSSFSTQPSTSASSGHHLRHPTGGDPEGLHGCRGERRPRAAGDRNPSGRRHGHPDVHRQPGHLERLRRRHLRRVLHQRARRGLHTLRHRHGRRSRGGHVVDHHPLARHAHPSGLRAGPDHHGRRHRDDPGGDGGRRGRERQRRDR